MKKNYETMVFTPNHFDSEEVARKIMWDDISTFIPILMRQSKVATIRQEERDIIVVEYENDERLNSFGCANPYWMTEEEYFDFVDNNE
jgi:hypothetical protein